jgi:hypothetical protein
MGELYHVCEGFGIPHRLEDAGGAGGGRLGMTRADRHFYRFAAACLVLTIIMGLSV